MSKIAAIGPKEAVLAFRALGLTVRAVIATKAHTFIERDAEPLE